MGLVGFVSVSYAALVDLGALGLLDLPRVPFVRAWRGLHLDLAVLATCRPVLSPTSISRVAFPLSGS
jgi:hypothetical protein